MDIRESFEQYLADFGKVLGTELVFEEDHCNFTVDGAVEIELDYYDDSDTVVASLGAMKCPDGFAEEALAGNFFWSGTDGATLSYNEAENAFYLTDRFDDDAFSDDDAFEAYVAGFMRTVVDWRGRLAVYLPEPQDHAEEVR